jgi:hypothetical protein
MLKRLRCWVNWHKLEVFVFYHNHMEGPHEFRACINCGAMFIAKEKVKCNPLST